jgi:hypothetical protein
LAPGRPHTSSLALAEPGCHRKERSTEPGWRSRGVAGGAQPFPRPSPRPTLIGCRLRIGHFLPPGVKRMTTSQTNANSQERSPPGIDDIGRRPSGPGALESQPQRGCRRRGGHTKHQEFRPNQTPYSLVRFSAMAKKLKTVPCVPTTLHRKIRAGAAGEGTPRGPGRSGPWVGRSCRLWSRIPRIALYSRPKFRMAPPARPGRVVQAGRVAPVGRPGTGLWSPIRVSAAGAGEARPGGPSGPARTRASPVCASRAAARADGRAGHRHTETGRRFRTGPDWVAI